MTLTQDMLDLAGKGSEGLEEPERKALHEAAEKLTFALENPFEKFIRLFTSLYNPIVIRIAIDLNLVDIALAHGGPITSASLASQSKADPELVYRLLRLLVQNKVFAATSDSPPQYTVLPFGHTLSTRSPLRSGMLHFSNFFPATAAMPAFFQANGYQDPKDARYAPFSFAYQAEETTYFDYLNRPENERMATAFNATMALKKSGEEATFVSTYPVKERLRIDDPERVLFVDVGGGVGHQLLKFRERAEGLPGKLVLQDLPVVIAQADALPEDVVKVGHDFFQPLPDAVRNAKAFYMRNILHDWPQIQANNILKNVVDVMAKDSVVLVHEIIMPEKDVPYFDAMMDWHMMDLGALERTEEQWRSLLGEAGLEIKGIWREEQGLKGLRALIECGLKS